MRCRRSALAFAVDWPRDAGSKTFGVFDAVLVDRGEAVKGGHLVVLGGDDEDSDLKRRENAGIALGVAAARNWNSNRQKSTTGATFTGGTVDQSHLAADAVFKWEGLAIQGEYLWKRSATDVIVSTNSDGSTKKEPTRSAYGWIAQASYVFETPYEVVARASRMTAISGTDPAFVADLHAHGQEFAFGVNRYLNGHRFKLQATWIARTPRDVDFTKAEHTAYVLGDATM